MQRKLRQWRDEPYMMYFFLGLQILLFLVMTLFGGSQNSNVLVFFGAKVNILIQQGQWWRLIMPIFLHSGLMHIAVNSVTLYFIGMQIESLFGHWRFTLIYLLSGIVGNIASFVFNMGISVGASTALFGLFGAFFMLVEAFRQNTAIRAMGQQFALFIVLNLAFDLFNPGIDLAGHVGGLLGGFLVANIVGVPRIRSVSVLRRIITLIILVLASGIFLYMGFTN
ncbi:MAG: rhomboid family intramembrane serine protease [Loigolactobacillus coryniformis]|jgi:rhomboid protease GluP|uniref:Membrane-associated serine protease n=2 Tax=Loigolactobacillus coryniformis subsp. coryniformis TaxID=115541 RepID=J3JCG4_9LACO|nr:rhomboid family intramembrane serine protease [Loigolactobacillus coryniformis]MDT3391301.1 rhomboid family intramembrane serine protease [Bacillota bacterium]OEH90760.1 rhomboid family intramembrane serine protease [Loigolactobacillus coryniformis subsp. coryniformis]ATO55689.1 rhomboid family intramembrane serine protease [Loigolactobacillus coryniformis subsp. coryniformis KCTC 3167 = DSM 20001]EJN56584.1 Membrane-associated serine protease [Loigolactobacillus coryniformis subsp. corynifo